MTFRILQILRGAGASWDQTAMEEASQPSGAGVYLPSFGGGGLNQGSGVKLPMMQLACSKALLL